MRMMLGGVARAGAPGLLVPAGILLALLVAATVGGGLRGLGQLVQGPEVPAATRPAPDRRAEPRPAVRVPAIPAAAPAAQGGSATRTARPEAGAAPGAPASPGAGGRPAAPSPAAGQPGTPSPGTPSHGTSPSPSPAPSPVPAPAPVPALPGPGSPDPIRQVGGAVADTIRQAPVVGPPAADAVQGAVDLVDPPGGGSGGAVALP